MNQNMHAKGVLHPKEVLKYKLLIFKPFFTVNGGEVQWHPMQFSFSIPAPLEFFASFFQLARNKVKME